MARRGVVPAVITAVAVALVAALAFAVARAQRPPSGPVELAWDKAACERCRMHVGEPAFAAQLQTRDGRVLAFDDPGCLILYEAERKPDVHAVYFHDLRGPGWLSRDAVAFVPVSPTPMGYGLGAVAAGTEGAISYAEARERILRSEGEGQHVAP